MKLNKPAFREVLTDTLIATLINFPLNFLLIWFAFRIELSAFMTTVFCTSLLFIIAMIRKYYIRIHFERRANGKKA